MAAYQSLSDADKLKLSQLLDPVRSFAGELARLGNHAQAATGKWYSGVDAIVASLDDGELIPNTSREDGAEPLTKQDVVNLLGYLIDFGNTADNSPKGYQSNYQRALYIRAVGLANTLG